MNNDISSYRALTAKWSKFNREAQKALIELWDVECSLEDLDRMPGGRENLPPSLREHLSRIDQVNVDALTCELLEAEVEDDTYFLKDGSAPATEPAFV